MYYTFLLDIRVRFLEIKLLAILNTRLKGAKVARIA